MGIFESGFDRLDRKDPTCHCLPLLSVTSCAPLLSKVTLPPSTSRSHPPASHCLSQLPQALHGHPPWISPTPTSCVAKLENLILPREKVSLLSICIEISHHYIVLKMKSNEITTSNPCLIRSPSKLRPVFVFTFRRIHLSLCLCRFVLVFVSAAPRHPPSRHEYRTPAASFNSMRSHIDRLQMGLHGPLLDCPWYLRLLHCCPAHEGQAKIIESATTFCFSLVWIQIHKFYWRLMHI